MLKLKLQDFGHLMRRVESLEKTLMLGSIGKDMEKLELLCLVQFSSVAQSCPTLCDPMDCSPSGSSLHRIF